MTAAPQTASIAPEDAARAEVYDFLATLLAAPPGAELLGRCAALPGDEETRIGRAVAEIAADAARTGAAEAEREYTRLFIGLGRGELLPFASHYLTGNLHDKPLARLRGDMGRIGIVRAENVSEPEDHIASICEMMAGLIDGRYGAVAPIEAQKAFFVKHLAPWGPRFFADLEAADNAVLYAGVGTLGVAFMEIEAEAFDL